VAQERPARRWWTRESSLRDAELNLEFSDIRAPQDGFMSSSSSAGALITAQQTLLTTLYSSDPMWVLFSVSEDKLLELQKRLKHSPGEQPDQTAVPHPAGGRQRIRFARALRLYRCCDRSEERYAAGPHLGAQS
jgi:multidrug efflux pump subunit AcrA (membrane-fusion protein)